MITHDTAISILDNSVKDLEKCSLCLDVSYGIVSGVAYTFYLCDVISESEYEHYNDAIDAVYMGVEVHE